MEDHFRYTSSNHCVSNITKRTLLSDVSKHFDPIDLQAPILVVAKVIIQSCWMLEFEWNDAIPDNASRAYTNWKDDMCSLSQLKIPRKVLPTHLYDEATVQVFCDASEEAYGACVYLLSVKGDIVSSTLISTNCKVAPIEPSALSRLELLAIHTGAKLTTAVSRALSKSKPALNIPVLYSDSTIALSWIKAEIARWHTIVSNSGAQIQSKLPTTEFLHVPSEENPEDLYSRWLLATQLDCQQKFWFEGPSWLGSSFPVQPHTLLTKEESCQEVKSLTVLNSPSVSLQCTGKLFWCFSWNPGQNFSLMLSVSWIPRQCSSWIPRQYCCYNDAFAAALWLVRWFWVIIIGKANELLIKLILYQWKLFWLTRKIPKYE